MVSRKAIHHARELLQLEKAVKLNCVPGEQKSANFNRFWLSRSKNEVKYHQNTITARIHHKLLRLLISRFFSFCTDTHNGHVKNNITISFFQRSRRTDNHVKRAANLELAHWLHWEEREYIVSAIVDADTLAGDVSILTHRASVQFAWQSTEWRRIVVICHTRTPASIDLWSVRWTVIDHRLSQSHWRINHTIRRYFMHNDRDLLRILAAPYNSNSSSFKM